MKSDLLITKLKINWILPLLVVFLSSPVLNAHAQSDLNQFKHIIKEDSTLIHGLAGYDATLRQDILTVGLHPEVLTKMSEIQTSSRSTFKNIVEEYDRDTQFGLYELSRYPDLIKALAKDGKKTKKEIDQIITAYPEDIHEAAKSYGRKRFNALNAIYHLNEKNGDDFRQLISTYSMEFQTSIQRLLDYPEVLSTMSENIEFTRLAGSVHQQYPKEMSSELEQMHNRIKAQKEAELADYQKQLKEDPEAYKEMLEAAEQFAAEESATQDIKQPIEREVEVIHVNHYSYWYGYPHWYGYPYWRPYPWYYHTGFYYGPGGGMIFIGMPSYWYVGWHHRYYPNRYHHLTYHYYRHAHRHPRSHYNFNRSVNININKNVNINRNDLAKIDHRKGNIIRPAVQPGNNMGNPTQLPAVKPESRPNTRPTTRPAQQPATRPSTRPTQQPTTRPSTRPTQQPATRPSTRPATPPVRYNNYRSNESFRQNWSRPATPPRPVTRPGGGGSRPARRR